MTRFRCVHNHIECSSVPLGNCSREVKHDLKSDSWRIDDSAQGTPPVLRWRARCVCGERSGILTTAGMVSGWWGQHMEEVRNGQST